MQKFNLDIWLQDKSRKIVTRRGNPVRIICTDRKHGEDELPVVFLEQCRNGEFLLSCRKDGRSDTYDTPYDLFFADEEERLSEFEKELVDLVSGWCDSHIETPKEYIKKHSQTLLDLAKNELKNSDWRQSLRSYKDTYEQGKQDALKDLPKWKKMPNGVQGNGDFNPTYLIRISNGYYFTSPCISWDKDSMYVELSELEKLPKEE